MRDSGAQPERTRLAWRRTILTATVVAVLAVRQAFHDGITPGAGLLAALLALTWLGLCVGVQLRIRTLARARPGAMRPPWPALLTATVLLLASLASLGLLVHPGHDQDAWFGVVVHGGDDALTSDAAGLVAAVRHLVCAEARHVTDDDAATAVSTCSGSAQLVLPAGEPS